MGLPTIDVVTLRGAGDCPIYPVKFEVTGLPAIDVNGTVGADLKPMGLLALIGRDLLQHCTFVFDGKAGRYSLSA